MELTESGRLVLAVFSFILGSMVGSFLNVCVHRLPQGLSVVKPRSRCPKCESPIAWFDNIPMLSWLILGAKCRKCGLPISWQYPLVEAITGALFLAVYWRFGLVAATPIYMAFVAAMVLVTFVDLTDWTIPNEVTFPGIPLGIALAVAGLYFPDSGLLLGGPIESMIAGFAGGTFLYLLDKAALLLLGKRGMGFGDVKLIAMVGTFFGYKGVVVTIIIACFAGSIIGIAMILLTPKKEGEESAGHYLPFGPYLAAGAVLHLFFGPQWVELYLSTLNPAI